MKTLGQFLDDGIILTQRDFDWMDEAAAWNWMAPPQAQAALRLWGIRHARAIACVVGAYLSFKPLQPDWHALWRAHWLAYAIRRGWY